jgi:hypothetical protein
MISVRVDDQLKEKMSQHPEINWSEHIREQIEKKIDQLEAQKAIEIMNNIAEKTGNWNGQEEITRWRKRDE